jgi:TolB protein
MLLWIAMVLGAVTTSAWAAFPGANGLIAFQSNRDGNDQIYVMNQQNVSNHPANDEQPNWSPDGTRIVFRRGDDDAEREIWVMDADGSGQAQLTFNETEDEGVAAWHG